MYQDILLHLDTYPDPTPIEALPGLIDFCSMLGANVTAAVAQVTLPARSNSIAEGLLGLSEMAKGLELRCRKESDALLERFDQLATAAGLRHEASVIRVNAQFLAEEVARRARTHDVAVVARASNADGQRSIAEAVLFGAGRPVVLLPITGERSGRGLKRVAVAWDGSRSAARAVADAMPLLTAADAVDIVSVTSDKPKPGAATVAELVSHLARHGVTAGAVTLDAASESAASLIARHAGERADLLVMGGYGHARMLEFVLGGVTETILSDPPTPVFLSH